MATIIAHPTGKVLLTTNQSGKPRTVRLAQIDDLEGMDNDCTRVFYRNGRTVVVAMPFDRLFAEWTKELELEEWQPR